MAPALFACLEAKRAIVNVDPLDEDQVEKISMVLSTDGTALGLCVPGTALTLLSLHSLMITDRLERDACSSCLMAVFSPNGVCVACILQRDAAFHLEIWSLSEVSIGTNGLFENPKAVCMWDSMRLTWTLLTNADPWDACQRVQRHAIILPESLKYFSLFYLDGMLHRHVHATRPHYAEPLDRIKIRILLPTRDPALQVILMDLYSRRMITNLVHGFASAFPISSQDSHTDLSMDQWTAGDKATCRRWILWMEDFFRLMCNCIKTWAERSASPSDRTSSAVPFIRLLGDTHFTKRLSVLLVQFSLASNRLFPSPLSSQKHQFFKVFCCDTVKQIHAMVKSANPHSEIKAVETWEGMNAFRDLVSQTRKTCFGPVHLHYARLDGPVTKDVMKMIYRLKSVRESVALSQEEIETKAIELGLLPDQALRGFLFMKETERRSPFPSPHKSFYPRQLPFFDCLSGRTFADDDLIFYAVDQSCIAHYRASHVPQFLF